MSRRAFVLSLLLSELVACSRMRDVYVGSDAPIAGESRELGGQAGALAEPPRVNEPRPMAADEPQPMAADAAPPPDAAPAGCQGAFADCDGDPANGCEVDLASSRAHCGRCGNACSTPDCACVGAELVVSCPPGRADCDGAPANGCEVDTATSMQHCGSCQRTCHMNGHDALSAVCVAGQCRLTCQRELDPEADCDGDPDNGCETTIWRDDLNCGACGVRCTCSMGVCI
jgi:hypothetical protein